VLQNREQQSSRLQTAEIAKVVYNAMVLQNRKQQKADYKLLKQQK